ncbi:MULTISPECIES: ectoine/hydroxyectoine ABC transporter ATP-binding protein EhuA [unclassified Pseudonocardia]|jgi:polar amino acid transport system ATP-binding protein|uniref:ectoine/hydroxyectoine ABC transporter ATP-binding protein EhuA n=1 Tax=unclassified Pseudonocardia TaxID=2619320 RepID=UPI00095C375B|nr:MULTISPECIES: ectoine/hydroxyectoine ABC transporter ATP-binding protein EhuA [unclassified Pseudonocardia]MBN9097394.1 ectoine/hydroxyectoine ABC transporter ATP-binding protein EhuA [Pseudonocardia sp.]OJY48946.1 MAG: ectoine/hydroxyectoine ABC transporter ATP-binding protein EhuA [Pseudonocardia sp. 73-21]
MIVFEGVEKRFGDNVVLSDLDFTVASGEHVTLIGPSGSGKTTILRLLMCLEAVSDGVIRVGGRPLSHMEKGGRLVPADEKHSREVRKHIGMVFQQFNLFPNMTVRGNLVEAPTRVLGLSRDEADARAVELLDLVGLAEKIDEHPSRLSGGQQQRVAIARALAMRPDVLLLDEVTSALDPELVAGVLKLLREIGETTDITILCVTHEMGFARDFSHRVMMFDGGRIVEDAPPEELFTAPREPRTQEFLRAVLGR